MDEYIEREELKKIFSNEAVHCLTFQKKGEARGLIKAKEIVSKLPTADVVKVVRCWKCRHCDPVNKHCDHYTGTSLPFPRKETDFCSYGELKEREG